MKIEFTLHEIRVLKIALCEAMEDKSNSVGLKEEMDRLYERLRELQNNL